MKVINMTSPRGNKVTDQFIIKTKKGSYFQSYNSTITFIPTPLFGGGLEDLGNIILDEHYWNYSSTTSKYRNIFLGETTKETQAKIDSGEYKLANLN